MAMGETELYEIAYDLYGKVFEGVSGETLNDNNCNILSYKKEYEHAKINGYVYDEYFQTLTLVVSVFENRMEISKMGKVDIVKNSKQATKFYRMCKSGYFNDVEETDPGFIISECTATTALSLERFEQIEPGKNFHSLPDELKSQYENPSRTQNTVYRRLDPNMPSETVVNVRKSMWIHPKFNRAVSAREAARLQSFPDDYIFYGTKDSVYQQIGNAVPPVLGRAVAEVVLDLLGVDKGNYRTLASIYKKCKK